MSFAYLDSSAIVKLVVIEEHGPALRDWLTTRTDRVSSAVARTEVVRAVRQLGPTFVMTAQSALRDLALIALDDQLLDSAARLDPPDLRSLDAIHLASALSLGDDLEAIVTYDRRMIEGAQALGLATVSPGLS